MPKQWLFALLLTASLTVAGADAPSVSPDLELERRVTAIAEELRCLVCQNQTIADSHAELATDLKNQVRQMLKQGMTDREIREFMVQRYGDFVLYRPPMKAATWVLWAGPFLLLAGGLGFLLFKLRQRTRCVPDESVVAQQHERAMALLGSPAETQIRKESA
jgi:cytochrome c-type biogenesis protein CcmH